jgi:hypothetical protein|tara:strand:+ start:353 stop:874 length:522 start_codon:yes stop_codon:yes gene_type:complete
MGSEFFINSQDLEDKIRQLLPSQGGAGAGFDLSASTQIIPIIDLTESAEGSNLREDLQTSISYNQATAFAVAGATTTIINNTGYYRIFGTFSGTSNDSSASANKFSITDGVTPKIIWSLNIDHGFDDALIMIYDFNVFLDAGDSITCTSGSSKSRFSGVTRQIADITGTLVNP